MKEERRGKRGKKGRREGEREGEEKEKSKDRERDSLCSALLVLSGWLLLTVWAPTPLGLRSLSLLPFHKLSFHCLLSH